MTRNRLYILVLVFSLVGYGLVFYNIRKPAEVTSTRTLCLFKTVTKVACPACGTTRSVAQIAQGQISRGIQLNPLGFLAALLLVASPLIVVSDLIRKKNRFYDFFKLTETTLQNRWIAFTAILLIIANWIWNIVKGI
jgi:hypothetical protein